MKEFKQQLEIDNPRLSKALFDLENIVESKINEIKSKNKTLEEEKQKLVEQYQKQQSENALIIQEIREDLNKIKKLINL